MEQSTLKLPASALDSVDAPLSAAGRGSALYVINLCASMAPIASSDKPPAGFERYRVYQVSRKEDGRIRYRLRLGFFSDQAEAETALACIREHYPTAFATSLCEEDQRHTRGFAQGPKPAVVTATPMATPVAKPTAPPTPVQPSKRSASPAATTPTKPAVVAKPTDVARSPSAPAPTPKPAAAGPASKPGPTPSDTQRFLALKLPQAPQIEIEVEWEPAATTASAASKPATDAASVTDKMVAAAPVAPTTAATGRHVAVPAPAAANELTLASEPVAVRPAAAPSTGPDEPFHVGKGVNIPASTLSLEPEPAPTVAKPQGTPVAGAKPVIGQSPKSVQPAARPAAERRVPLAAKQQAVAKPPAPAAKSGSAKVMAAPPPLPKPPVVLGDDSPLPDLDSTQTIRALTAAELDDETQPKWFAVQLAVSEQPINLDTMPHLDIFSAYRLYSVATAGGGKILHHMRIGFFKEVVSAEAVSGYLKTFFANPTVLRISVAEQTRFAEAPVKPAAASESKGKVVPIASARERAPAREIPVVTMEVTPNPSASGRYPKPNTEASGIHKQPTAAKTAAKSAAVARTAPKKGKSTSSSGKHKNLQEALLAEAREVELSESAIRRLPKNSSLLSKLFGKK